MKPKSSQNQLSPATWMTLHLLCKQAGKGGWVVAGLTFKNHGKALDVSVQGVAAWYVQGAQKYLF